MHRFWARHIKPIVETLAPRRIIEVGAEFGWNTRHLLAYCRETGCRIDIIDPAPHPALHDVRAAYSEEHAYHPLKSVEALPLVAPADLVLLDGDHNWHTVYNELALIFIRAAETGTPPPVVLFHDVAWPYARRDMYYAPTSLLEADRHPYAYRGMLPGRSALIDTGLNGHFANALHEGGPCNGVLTAVEDFKASSGVPMALYQLPFFNGLGILAPDVRMTPALQAVIDGFFSGTALMETCVQLERDGMTVRAELATMQANLTRKTEALMRARALIVELQQELDGARRSSPVD
ncbi:MAG TPA: class I SAM-dependent methyltransferase [Aliidongia sp.]|uniref:class I SAM-dependent methyltransferase n=1 Tax=Aliidongia sp. TaxID=1914230 RepID=UPI002DDD4225|nr:class I SAM-dependent methyltransferase [Aliidongia sp.]HEV2677620.1 class I SAM-dependent methyltransferase [Aliidongia sp.]